MQWQIKGAYLFYIFHFFYLEISKKVIRKQKLFFNVLYFEGL